MLDFVFQATVGRRDEPHIYVAHMTCPNRPDLSRLKEAQQLGLHAERHLPDLVEEDRPSIRPFQQACVVRGRPGECPSTMTEELAFEQGLRDRRGVHGGKGHLRADTRLVKSLADQLLAGPGPLRSPGPCSTSSLPAPRARAAERWRWTPR